MILTSSQNPRIKYLKRLIEENRFRRKEGKIVLEGSVELNLAMQYGWKLQEYFWTGKPPHFPETIPEETLNFEVEKSIFDGLVFRKMSQNCVAVFNAPPSLKEFNNIDAIKRILLLDSLEKPGNLGAIIRSAEVFGVNHIILTGGNIDKYNPQVLRNSMGAAMAMTIVELTNEEAHNYLLRHNFTIYTTFLEGEFAARENTLRISECKLDTPSVIVLGNEHSGVSQIWGNNSQNISIPMYGKINSLNLSNAAAILLYEWTKKTHQ